MNFGEAIQHMKNGSLIQRKGWNGRGMYVCLTTSPSLAPYMTLHPPHGLDQPGWNASTADVLAEDWGLVARDGARAQSA